MLLLYFSFIFTVFFSDANFAPGGPEGTRTGPINLVWNGKEGDNYSRSKREEE